MLENFVAKLEESNRALQAQLDGTREELSEQEKVNAALVTKNKALTESQANNDFMLASQLAAQTDLQAKHAAVIDENKTVKTQMIALKVR